MYKSGAPKFGKGGSVNYMPVMTSSAMGEIKEDTLAENMLSVNSAVQAEA